MSEQPEQICPLPPATDSAARCRLAIGVGKDWLTLPYDMPRDYAEALGKEIEQWGAVTWYLPPNAEVSKVALTCRACAEVRRTAHRLRRPVPLGWDGSNLGIE